MAKLISPRVALCATTLTSILFAARPVAAETRYSVTAIGDTSSFPCAINDSGQVAGYTYNPRAFLYSDGAITFLDPLPGGDSCQAFGINASGQMVGGSHINASNANNAILFSNGNPTDLGTLGGSNTVAIGINDSGQIIGTSSLATGPIHSFLYQGGNMTDLGTLPNAVDTEAAAINNKGQIVGLSGHVGGACHAFLYSDGIMSDLGGLPNMIRASGDDINNSGQIVGWCELANGYHAVLYSQGEVIDLGTLGGNISIPTGINDSGVIVGTSGRAFVYTQAEGMQNLQNLVDPSLGWQFMEAWEINNAGQIIGWGYGPTGESGFLLTPIPEPGCLGVFAVGSLVLLFRRTQLILRP